MTRSPTRRTELALFFVLIAAVALGNGLSDSVYANYFKDAYRVTAMQRALIEFPRELPGLLCAFVVSALSAFGDVRTSLAAQAAACLGLAVPGLYTPTFAVMLVFLFINSLGMHLFQPLSNAIGMGLAEPGRTGQRIGQFYSVKTAFGFAAGLLVFFGFRSGFFSFLTPRKPVFLIGALCFLLAAVISGLLSRHSLSAQSRRARPFLRKRYSLYYLLMMLHGGQKQITYVFGIWVIVDLMGRGADTISLLLIASSFIGVFFMRFIGRRTDRLGILPMLRMDAGC